MTLVPAPGYLPIYNPMLPFKKAIPGGLHVGMAIYIEGVTNKNPIRFTVNFALGTKPEADIAFHFSPCFDRKDQVVFNSLQSGCWGKMQMKHSLPFRKGDCFELLVMVLQEHYKVMVNGNPFYEFVHRMPPQDVTHLYVLGDLTLQFIGFFDCSLSPSQAALRSNLLTCNPPPMQAPPVFNPPVPYVVNLLEGLIPNKTFIIKGVVLRATSSIAINFRVGATGDIALHINPRIQEGIVVRNSFLNGQWGPEETSISCNPFVQGRPFDLFICASPYGFKVFASGQHIFDYQYRMFVFTTVNMLTVDGDVSLSYIHV
ncbi:galectin-4-like [Suncus etruscus]|uniref:galectin-4-like n=1 Tax=Suncus etruscus TaxID=109475 RepID=UPI002110158D|nr:galectin-4-like [Suncus etruscus]